jgi:hypothetical protein
VDTASWSELGGPGTIDGWNGILTVSQTEENQGTIARLLSALREMRKQQAAGQIGKPVFVGRLRPPPPKVEKLLSLKTSLFYQEKTLADVFADLKERTGIEVVVDAVALTDSGIDVSARTVTLEVQNVSVRAALDHVLGPAGLNWTFKDDVVYVTTKDEADTLLTIGVYPVADLAGPHAQTEIEKKLEFPESNAQELIHLITGEIATASWSSLGGPGTIGFLDPEYPVIVCAQSLDVHESIGRLLDDLRRVRRTQAEELAKQATQPLKPPAPVLEAYALRPGDQNVPAVPPKEIALLVKALTGPKIWEQEDVFIQGFTGKLIVKHTPAVHRKVRKILQEIEVLNVVRGQGAGGRRKLGGGLGGGSFGGGGF